MSCGTGRRCDWDLALLWLWCRPTATAPFGPLARELLYAMYEALKKKKDSALSNEVFAFGST